MLIPSMFEAKYSPPLHNQSEEPFHQGVSLVQTSKGSSKDSLRKSNRCKGVFTRLAVFTLWVKRHLYQIRVRSNSLSLE